MASQVQIANRALSKIGDARILALTDDSERARLISSLWDVVRDAELRARTWNFSVKRASLAALVSSPEFGFDYEYQLPTDCLRVLMVGEYYPGPSMTDYRSFPEQAWQIEGRKILTDLSAPLYIRYVAAISDTGSWDALFSETFACRLAVEVAERLTQSGQKRELAWREYEDSLRTALRADAIENPPEPLPDDSWLLSRL